jgi:hypothetical protein
LYYLAFLDLRLLITTSLSSSFSANIHIGFLQTNLFATGLLLASEKFDANICVS